MLVDRQRSELEANSTSHRTLINGDISKSELDYVTLASVTEGYTASDLKDLVGGALQQAVIRSTQSGEQASYDADDGAQLIVRSLSRWPTLPRRRAHSLRSAYAVSACKSQTSSGQILEVSFYRS